ncbi:hypothetical protein [Variovorax sp. J31P207]|uniref:hypothetical protein n=1 Tax=Variovorax sp. J31P207 TaxID=3053510 RepID=UPI0025787261|nr:hypothetical protein [Variovorax sp. J31P207]MDM0069929.1 hypothetical protein [Variovorax sp. J31P207]
MNPPVVLITGALTGIGRATLLPSPVKAIASPSAAGATKPRYLTRQSLAVDGGYTAQ